ncbi:serine/threonine protein kinase [Azotobacter armeniacus]
MGELEITGVLGIGGFGIVYRAFDHTLQRVVAIKEYMPSMLAVRRSDLTVSLRGERYAATFQAGQAGFINEARLLAQFDHPGLIKVLRFWEDYGTAYMATPFYEGQTLEQRLAGGRALAEAEILRLIAALLGALETLHRAQCFHRDIALDNILIQPDGRPILLDFGAARKLIGDLVDDSTIMLKPGYAPIEQYTDDPSLRQGPWTDLYALGAVIHVLVSGTLPPAAVVRSIQDNYVPLAGRALGYGQPLLQATDRALQLCIEDRPQNVVGFAALLGLQSNSPGQYSMPDPPAPPSLPPHAEPAVDHVMPTAPLLPPEDPAPHIVIGSPAADTGPRAPFRSRLLALGVVLLTAGGIAFALLQPETTPKRETTPQPEPQAAATQDWKLARATDTVAAYQRYLQQYAGGPHEVEARALLATATAREAPRLENDEAEAQVLLAADAAPEAPSEVPLSIVTPKDAAKPDKVAKPDKAVKPVLVRLHIVPWGEVYVAGRKRGVSPPLKTLSLVPGSYNIEVRNGELPPYRTRLVVAPGSSGNNITISHHFE